jgi:hypothetical protein
MDETCSIHRGYKIYIEILFQKTQEKKAMGDKDINRRKIPTQRV